MAAVSIVAATWVRGCRGGQGAGGEIEPLVEHLKHTYLLLIFVHMLLKCCHMSDSKHLIG